MEVPIKNRLRIGKFTSRYYHPGVAQLVRAVASYASGSQVRIQPPELHNIECIS